jgi:hypothetical protein
MLVTFGIVLLVQLPNLLNFLRPWENIPTNTEPVKNEQIDQLNKQFKAGQISSRDYVSQKTMFELEAREELKSNEVLERLKRTTRLICGVLPPGWVALGMGDLGSGHIATALYATFGLGLIGTLSLVRAYRTTIRMYTQGGTASIGASRNAVAPGPVDKRPNLMEWKLPWISEYASTVALAGFRSLMRAPEAKMLLLTPIVMLVVFVGGFASSTTHGQQFGPLVVLGMAGMMLASVTQFVVNIFGFDRDGFRVFVLSPIPRREILLGKNLALAPLILTLGFIVITGAGFIIHLRWDQFLAAYIQIITMYLLFCLLGNACSIYAPFMISAGSLKGMRPKLTLVLAQFGCVMISPCVVGLPATLPSLIELALSENGMMQGLPISLGISALIFAASLWCYGRILNWEGELLAGREQKILEAVTKRIE